MQVQNHKNIKDKKNSIRFNFFSVNINIMGNYQIMHIQQYLILPNLKIVILINLDFIFFHLTFIQFIRLYKKKSFRLQIKRDCKRNFK